MFLNPAGQTYPSLKKGVAQFMKTRDAKDQGGATNLHVDFSSLFFQTPWSKETLRLAVRALRAPDLMQSAVQSLFWGASGCLPAFAARLGHAEDQVKLYFHIETRRPRFFSHACSVHVNPLSALELINHP